VFLVVDDHTFARELLTEQLQHLGYDVDSVSSGMEALQAVLTTQYTMIFMDVLMPVMDGLETTREIRQLELNLKRRHTFITAVTAIGDERSCYEAGMDAYLQKPCMLDSLKTAVEGWLAVV
jgi:CheY-like chemotaxis protein